MQNSYSYFSSNWDVKFIDAAISLYKGIWGAWNKHRHGSTWEESSMLQRKKIQDQVIRLCHYPPRLASRNSSIKRIPLEDRLKKSTTHLKHWISRIKHQVNVSDLLHMKDRERQCCIWQSKWWYKNNAEIPPLDNPTLFWMVSSLGILLLTTSLDKVEAVC